MTNSEQKLYKRAWLLSLFTIFYNVAEGLVSMFFGYQDETLALFGFGVDSFIEVMSGIGIAVMILRIKQNPESNKSDFEKTALRITGIAFYLLSAGLLAGIIVNLITKHKPETTLWGVIISSLSILVMIWLMYAKKRIGLKLNSEPIVADSNCTKVCVYMSVVLLLSSLIYELTGFAYADVIGAAGLIYFSFTEGKEAFEMAKGKECSCGCHCSK
ncbi:MAG: cation transporter [Tannerellaceae bacterium]|jgi:divalent metal cation (Fe/Co/Zn/Cd) transporter|nr:cation transporter [uncultured Macellibacteroides sp.]MBN2659972.1 cation transporter [Tannerellaceae bacterium]MBP8760630.1 cation transporter [Parabacteroides sp.]MCE5226500.1 cation transporter [Porphyromonadaceae bacterium]MBP9482101.1 cation transporter [Parabacteroides sp.]MDD4404578.1 cation transporter [Parabacteroides sp.]